MKMIIICLLIISLVILVGCDGEDYSKYEITTYCRGLGYDYAVDGWKGFRCYQDSIFIYNEKYEKDKLDDLKNSLGG